MKIRVRGRRDSLFVAYVKQVDLDTGIQKLNEAIFRSTDGSFRSERPSYRSLPNLKRRQSLEITPEMLEELDQLLGVHTF